MEGAIIVTTGLSHTGGYALYPLQEGLQLPLQQPQVETPEQTDQEMNLIGRKTGVMLFRKINKE